MYVLIHLYRGFNLEAVIDTVFKLKTQILILLVHIVY